MLLTFGHGTATAERMTELLRDAGVAVLVDVRTAPGSRRHPHVARAELERWLPEAGISYRWDKRLGGFRKAVPDSPDTAWREDMFRGYAAHMRTEEFQAAMDEVLVQAGVDSTAVMCAESLWWRCHRRLIADFAVATSGVAERREHIIDPYTGQPPAGLASITVVGTRLAETDAYATAAFAMGAAARDWVEGLDGYEAYAITATGATWQTSGFGRYLG